MSISLENLTLLYGIAGAREQFERLATLLVKGEHPDTRGIRIVVGDGGVDSSEGEWIPPNPVTVYQVKYFSSEIGDSQKSQIREAYKRARSNPRFILGKWILVLSVNLSADEQQWWDDWRSKQDVQIDLWDRLHVEHLLLQSKNAGIMEAFFPSESRTMIRDLHEKLIRGAGTPQLAAEVLFAQQRAAWTSPVIDQLRKRGQWESVIRPASSFQPRFLRHTGELAGLLRPLTIRFNTWSLPCWSGNTSQPVVGGDWLGQEVDNLFGPTGWRFYQSGQFVYVEGFPQDWYDTQRDRRPDDEEWEAKKYKYVLQGWTLSLTTGIFTLANRLAQTALFQGQDICIEITLRGIGGRYLITAPAPSDSFGPAVVSEFHYTVDLPSGADLVTYEQEARQAASEIFLRFQAELPAEQLREIQPHWK